MFTKHLKTVIFISIGVLVFLIFGFFGTRRLQTAALTQPQHLLRRFSRSLRECFANRYQHPKNGWDKRGTGGPRKHDCENDLLLLQL